MAEGVEGAKEAAFFRAALAGGSLVLVAIGTRVVLGVLRKRRAVQPTTPT